jgi:hypothetical protein
MRSRPNSLNTASMIASPPGSTGSRSARRPCKVSLPTSPACSRMPRRRSSPSRVMLARPGQAVHFEDVGQRLGGAAGADRLLPAGLAVLAHDGFELLARRQLGRLHAGFLDAAAREVLQAEADAAHVERFQLDRLDVAADDELRRTAADVHHQLLGARVGQGVGDAEVDQPRLLAAGDDLDGKAERRLGLGQELRRVLRHPQGIGGDRPHRAGIEAAQPLAEARQRLQRAQLRGAVEGFLRREAGRQAHRLLEGIERIDLVVHHPPDLQAEAVRAQIDGGDQFVSHGKFYRAAAVTRLSHDRHKLPLEHISDS